MFKFYYLLTVCFFLTFPSFGQGDNSIDSLDRVLDELNAEAKSYWRTDQLQGLSVAKKALRISKQHLYEKQQLAAYKNLGALYLFAGNYDSAFFYWDQGRLLAEIANDTAELISAYSNLAIAAQRSEKYELSLDLNRTALVEKLKLNDTSQIAVSYNNIGILYEELKQFEEAETNYREAIRLRLQLGDSLGLSSTYLNTGSLFFAQGLLDSAEYYISQSILFKKALNDQWGLANAYVLAGQIVAGGGKYEEAKVFFNNALEIARRLDHDILQVEANIELVDVLIKQGEVEYAREVVEKIDTQTIDEVPVKSKLRYFQLRSTIFELQGSYKQALRALEICVEIKDSLNNVLNDQSLERERNRLFYQAREQEQKLINELEKEQLMAKAERKQSQIILIAVIFLFLLAFCFTYFIWRKKKTALRKDIETKKVMMKELQHRVKNHLQFVNNILFLEKSLKRGDRDFIDRTSAKIAIITKIYDQLLQSKNEDLIPVKPYLTSLATDLLNLESNKVTLDLDISEMELDSDTVLALGLITNEAITNSLKYATQDQKEEQTVVTIALSSNSGIVKFEVADNGSGFIKSESKRASGLYLIEMLAEQIDAKYTLETAKGVRHTFFFSP